jgi:hypothetical protein
MSALADTLRPHFVNGVVTLFSRPDSLTVPDLIVSRRAAYSLDFDANQSKVFLDFRDAELVSIATASDCNRLFTAAFQSASSVATGLIDRYAVPWALIRLYYSAFYSAHAILRLLGNSACHFESRHTTKIMAVANAIGRPLPFSFVGGMYQCSVENAGTVLGLVKIGTNPKAGSHESFWAFYETQIRALGDAILLGPLPATVKQPVVAKFEGLRRLLDPNAAFGKLSRVRNDVQYRHIHETWYPTGLSASERQALSRSAARWNADPMSIDMDAIGDSTLMQFVRACVFQVAAVNAVSAMLSQRAPRGHKSFVEFRPNAYLNLIR